MKTEILSEKRSQLLERLEEVETANRNTKNKLSEAADSQTNVLQDSLDHASEQTNLSAHLEMNEKYVLERHQILDALDRINKGSFGECTECGETIPAKRLLVQPSASLCLECQLEKEVYEKSDLAIAQKQNARNALAFSMFCSEVA
jgi:RNA polymerase-binding protein DksA